MTESRSWTDLNRPSVAPKPPANDDSEWFELPKTLTQRTGAIRLRGAPNTEITEVLRGIRQGVYPKPFLLDDGETRSLHFDFKAVQSEMSRDAPNALTLAYTRKMMAFLLFQPNPQHVVIVGLGGGSLTKFCYRQLPRTRVTTVEIDEGIIELAELFEIPARDRRMQIVHADGVEYFATTRDDADVVLIDGCDRWGTAAVFCEPRFFAHVRNRLRPKGVLVMNLIGLKHRQDRLLAAVDAAFGTRYLVLKLNQDGNRVLFAFNDVESDPDWRRIKHRAELLKLQHGLDFPRYARWMQRSYQR